MNTAKMYFRPFQEMRRDYNTAAILFWLFAFIGFWVASTSGEKHLFPSLGQVGNGFKDLYYEGLKVHIISSLTLCFKATLLALVISLIIVYLSPIPILKPLAVGISKFRFLPLTGITFYLATFLSTGREMQIGLLSIFMSLYFITSMLSVIKDIPTEEFDHARSIKCSRWEVLWEVVIKGRLDYVIEVLRQNFAITWMMLVTVESIVVAHGGLGVMIKNSEKWFNHGKVVALQIIILLIGITTDYLLTKLRKGVFRYSKF